MPADSQRELVRKVTELLGADDLRRFRRLSPWRTVLTFLHIWLGLAVSFALVLFLDGQALWIKAITFPVLIIYIGTRINALGVQVHEASHYLLLPGRRLNDRFMNLFGGYWILNDTGSYRRMHHQHHAHLNTDADPDLPLYRLPTSRGGLLRRTLLDLFFVTAASRILGYLNAAPGQPRDGQGAESKGHLVMKLLCQLVIVALFVATFGAGKGIAYFFLFWVVPLFCVFPLIITLRISAEHHSPADGSGAFVSRTTEASWLERYLLGANMEYHFEHHLLPSVPHHQLRRLRRALRERGFFERPEVVEGPYENRSYLGFWIKLLRQPA